MRPTEREQTQTAGRTVAVDCAAPPDVAWELLATPARWPEWAPNVTRVTVARGHDARPPMLTEGQLLVVRTRGPVALRVRVSHVDRGRRWDWTIMLPGPWRLQAAHAVEPQAGGCRVSVTRRLEGPAARVTGPWLLRAETPLARRALRRLARLAEATSAAPSRPSGT